MTIGELNKNITRVGKTLSKISNGQKINSAADDASGYGISELMRVQIGSLEQNIQNVQNGSTMLKTAEAGMQQWIDILKTILRFSRNGTNMTRQKAYMLDKKLLMKL